MPDFGQCRNATNLKKNNTARSPFKRDAARKMTLRLIASVGFFKTAP